MSYILLFSGGHSSFFGFLNTFVHIIMYTYYMLAAMGPKVQKYLWWKKYLTVLQMVQFVLVMMHSFQLFIWNECNYPIGFAYFIGAHALMFYFLFANFYKSAYKGDKKVRFYEYLIKLTKTNLKIFHVFCFLEKRQRWRHSGKERNHIEWHHKRYSNVRDNGQSGRQLFNNKTQSIRGLKQLMLPFTI